MNYTELYSQIDTQDDLDITLINTKNNNDEN